MKLQRKSNRVVKGNTYDRWIVTIPPEIVRERGRNEMTDFEAMADRKGIRLKNRKPTLEGRRKKVH